MYGVRRTPFELGFISEIHYIIGPMFIIFGLYLGFCVANDYAKVSRTSNWSATSAKLTDVNAAPFDKGWFEPQNWFMKSATIMYSYDVADSQYSGATELMPQGIRTYNGIEGLSKSGDVASQLKREKALRDRALQNPGTVFAPIGGWRKVKTPEENAQPFAYSSLDPQHVLQVKYNPSAPTESVLVDVLLEHAKKLSSWAFGSVLIGVLVIVLFRFLQSAQQGAGADDDISNKMYDRMNH